MGIRKDTNLLYYRKSFSHIGGFFQSIGVVSVTLHKENHFTKTTFSS